MASKLDVEDGIRGKHVKKHRRGIVDLQNNVFRVRVRKYCNNSENASETFYKVDG